VQSEIIIDMLAEAMADEQVFETADPAGVRFGGHVLRQGL
jgi:hypothetical protein